MTAPATAGAVLEIDFDALADVNPDTAAWLHVPVLQISYPVVYAPDREYYTKHTFEGAYNTNGAIFIEPFNHPDFNDYNTFLYGHNSADGSMFGRLHELSFSDTSKPMGVATYRTSNDLPTRIREALPDMEELKKLL